MSSESRLLTDEQRVELERYFERLLKKAHEFDADTILLAASAKIGRARKEPQPVEVLLALDAAERLIGEIESEAPTLGNSAQRVAIAALQYLVDPWDLVPDSIPTYGLIDDAYVIELALRRISSLSANSVVLVPSAKPRPAINSDGVKSVGSGRSPRLTAGGVGLSGMPPGSGQHYAKRAKELGLLSPYSRRALYDLGSQMMRGRTLTPRQELFYEALLAQLVAGGILSTPCDRGSCTHCNALASLPLPR